MTKVAILQSNYIPWKGYFDLIASVDIFVWYDEVQYTKQDWRNRNRIKTENGLKWISVPVTVNGLYKQKMSETKVADPNWGISHWAKIEAAYKPAEFFDEISVWLMPLLTDCEYEHLFEINRSLIKSICKYLDIKAEFICSGDMELCDGKVDRLVNICSQLNAETYVSGPAAKAYLDIDLFTESNIQVEWFDYAGYTPYQQLWGDFEHHVSILDVLFNCGPESKKIIKAL